MIPQSWRQHNLQWSTINCRLATGIFLCKLVGPDLISPRDVLESR